MPTAALVILALAACAQNRPYVPPSEGHIAQSPKPVAESVIPPPARVSSFVPPPQPALKPQTYSVVVNEVPVKELLNALARDTRQNIDIHPGIQGLVSLNAIDETLPAILDRISRQVNVRFSQQGNTIVVAPDTPHMKTYRVNYVNVSRNISSIVNVSGEVGSVAGGAGGSAAGGAAGGAGGGGSRTTVTSTTSNDFWEQLRDNIRAILLSTGRQAASADERARAAEEARAARDDALKRAEAVSRAGPGAAALLQNAFPPTRAAATLTQSDTGTDVIINPMSGTISVLATEKQHQLVQQHLDNITNAAQRQVLIEATIVEVRLSDAYQAGVDLRRLATTGGFAIASLFGGGAVAAAAVAAGATTGGLTINRGPETGSSSNITASIRLLQEFGNTRVLSSPKVMAINNQTALLKAVDNIVYFEVQAQQGVTTAGGTITAPVFTTTAKTVAVGVVLGVTPQINEDGRVTLTVRPTVSRLLGPGKQDPNPNLCGTGAVVFAACISNVVPEVQIRELESVLQVASGQTVVLGGLMEDDVTFNREQIPGAGDLPTIGEAFRFRNERAQKRELIIFLRPTVIANASLESDELKFFQRYLPQVGGSAPARNAGAP
jgi:general secretion pathway protein D